MAGKGFWSSKAILDFEKSSVTGKQCKVNIILKLPSFDTVIFTTRASYHTIVRLNCPRTEERPLLY